MPDNVVDSNVHISSSPKIIIALDFDSRAACLELVSELDPKLCRLKIGKEMFTLFGPSLVEEFQQQGFEVFLDLKFHDIPNTVAKAVSAAASLGVWMVNVHASGGPRMMEAAKESLVNIENPPLLIAVTLLTSMNRHDIESLGITEPPEKYVDRLASLTNACELDGVVCSAQEAGRIKAACGSSFLTVTPGIRPAGSDKGDQRRTMTPAEAVANGSDYLVIGRPITQAANPTETLREIASSISVK